MKNIILTILIGCVSISARAGILFESATFNYEGSNYLTITANNGPFFIANSPAAQTMGVTASGNCDPWDNVCFSHGYPQGDLDGGSSITVIEDEIVDFTLGLVSRIGDDGFRIDYSVDAFRILEPIGWECEFICGDQVFNILSVDVVYTSVSEVPIPAAAWLFGSALAGLVGVSRRKKAQV